LVICKLYLYLQLESNTEWKSNLIPFHGLIFPRQLPLGGGFYSLPMKYFLHDTAAFEDEKISELFMNFGYEGLGLFYTILERIAKQEKPVKTSVLKHQLKVGKRLDKCWNFLESLELIYSLDGETFNENILNYSEKYQIGKEKNREKVSQWRENQKNKENVTSYVPESNPPKVKVSKVKESKVKVVKSAPILFKESEVFDLEKFKAAFTNSKYSTANLDYYYERVLNWSESGANKKIDWIATARSFMITDISEGKFITKDFKPNGKQFNNNRQTTAITPESFNEAHAKYFGS
jgi:hypothetical protein